jgi:hypothetical protein
LHGAGRRVDLDSLSATLTTTIKCCCRAHRYMLGTLHPSWTYQLSEQPVSDLVRPPARTTSLPPHGLARQHRFFPLGQSPARALLSVSRKSILKTQKPVIHTGRPRRLCRRMRSCLPCTCRSSMVPPMRRPGLSYDTLLPSAR